MNDCIPEGTVVLGGCCSVLGSTRMGGGDGGHRACTQVCPHQLCTDEQHEDIQDFPHPAAVGREAQNKLSPRSRGPGRESAEVRGKISQIFFDKSSWPINTQGQVIVLLLIFAELRPAGCQEALLQIRGARWCFQEAAEMLGVA